MYRSSTVWQGRCSHGRKKAEPILRMHLGKPGRQDCTGSAACAQNRWGMACCLRTVEFAVRSLHVGFSRIFPALGLELVEDWNADSHLPRYLKAEVVPKDSQYTRFQFLRKYTSATTHVWNWFAALPPDQQRR